MLDPLNQEPQRRMLPPTRFHGARTIRGLGQATGSALFEGRFGRMFRRLPPLSSPDNALSQLATSMIANPPADNVAIPAGFTYLGQFLDHDMTFDPTSLLMRENDPDALRTFRTPRFDLDSVYGRGPDDTPYLYQPDLIAAGDREVEVLHLRIGHNAADDTEDDLPRTASNDGLPRRALIGDPRNDENMIVSQLHLAFLKFHNAVSDALAHQFPDIPDPERFDEARRLVRWHYQWIIRHEFLPTIVAPNIVADVTTNGRKFFKWRNEPFIPVEFAVAAYRFGHSMVRERYKLNTTAPVLVLFGADPAQDLRGFRERPAGFTIEWHRFFTCTDQDPPIASLFIDAILAPSLGNLPIPVVPPHSPASLAERNLLRSKALGLPSGQAVARAMQLPVLTPAQLQLPEALASFFGATTPLWYYILREAAVLEGGARLGPVGGRIVAEVFIGLLEGDPFSYLTQAPDWTPTSGQFGAHTDAAGKLIFGMSELLTFAGVQI